jgi:hypothetical protein
MKKLNKDETLVYKILIEKVTDEITNKIEGYLDDVLRAVAVDVGRTIKENLSAINKDTLSEYVTNKKACSSAAARTTTLKNKYDVLSIKVENLEKELSAYREAGKNLREILKGNNKDN